jgi:hypothetical protein
VKKLKLESLEVTSFETSPSAAAERGTVEGHDSILPTPTTEGPQTYDVQACGDTRYFDCTYGCSINTDCNNTCVLFTETWDCVPPA